MMYGVKCEAVSVSFFFFFSLSPTSLGEAIDENSLYEAYV